jgi:hypothetical protein
MFRISLIVLGILCSRGAFAEEGYFLKYIVSAKGNPSSQKGVALGHQDDFSIFQTRYEGGFWIDNTEKQGAKSSAYISGLLGVEPSAGSVYVNLFQGIAAISCPDEVLGGPLQFVEEVGIGIRDQEKKVAVGLFYKHFSSAGIFMPNLGRDFIGVQVMIPW